MAMPFFSILIIALIMCALTAAVCWVLKKRKTSQTNNDALVSAAAEAIRQNAGAYSGLYQGMYRLAHSDWRAWDRWLGSMTQRTKHSFRGYALAQFFAEDRLPKTLGDTEKFAHSLLTGAQAAGLRICGVKEIMRMENAFVTQEGEEPDLQENYVLVSPAFVFDDFVLEKGIVKIIETGYGA